MRFFLQNVNGDARQFYYDGEYIFAFDDKCTYSIYHDRIDKQIISRGFGDDWGSFADRAVRENIWFEITPK